MDGGRRLGRSTSHDPQAGQMKQAPDIAALLRGLTDKQRDVLDLLVLHKTSKQIARDLGISPHTVDQRIATARKNFGVETRNALAAAYGQARAAAEGADIYESPVYQSSQVGISGESSNEDGGSNEVATDETRLERLDGLDGKDLPVAYYRVVPESFEGRFGYVWRIAAIVGITLGLLSAVLVGFAIYGELSELLR